jgi:hypothetical protein
MPYLCVDQLYYIMFARKKPKKGAVASRIKKMHDDAAAKGEKQYQADLSEAQKNEAAFKESRKLPNDALQISSSFSLSSRDSKRSGVNASPAKDVQARKSSGMYDGAVPVAGTSDKKLYAKRNPIKGIRRSEAKGHEKRSMIKKMKGAY